MTGTAKEHAVTGYERLHNPRLNKGTAFTGTERRAYRLEGLLPPAPITIELQVARVHAQLADIQDDLQKYLVLSDLQARNETLFYAVLMSDPATYMPLVYTPTVGEACQKFDHIFHAARGMYLPINARGRVQGDSCATGRRRMCASSSSPTASGFSGWAISAPGGWVFRSASSRSTRHVRACRRNIVCRSCWTSAPTIMTCSTTRSISACARTACAARSTCRLRRGVRRRGAGALPKMLHPVGGFRQYQRRSASWRGIVTRFAPTTMISRVPLAVALAGIFAALRITGQKLTDQRFLFLGGGSAGTGIAELISQAMALEGMDIAEASGPQCAVRHQWAHRDLTH